MQGDFTSDVLLLNVRRLTNEIQWSQKKDTTITVPVFVMWCSFFSYHEKLYVKDRTFAISTFEVFLTSINPSVLLITDLITRQQYFFYTSCSSSILSNNSFSRISCRRLSRIRWRASSRFLWILIPSCLQQYTFPLDLGLFRHPGCRHIRSSSLPWHLSHSPPGLTHSVPLQTLQHAC